MNKLNKIAVVLLILLITRVMYCVYFYNLKYENFNNKSIIVIIESINKVTEEGITYKVKYNNDKFILYIKTDESKSRYKYGDKIKIIASNYEIEKAGNPYEFDYKLYLNSNKIISRLYCVKVIEECENVGGSLSIIYNLQDKISNSLNQIMSEKYANILKSIIYGDDTFLDEDIKNKFTNIGIGHFLCVSGTHVIFLLSAYDKLTQSKRHVIPKIILLIYFYIMSLFNVSLLRAICMFILSNINKKLTFLQKFLISLYIVLLINPYYIFNLGVIFSFLSLLSINMFYSLINSFFTSKIKSKNKIVISVISNISLTISSQILILPFQLYYFGKITLICILSNLILSIILNSLLFTGCILFILFFIPVISNILIHTCNILIYILIIQVEFLDKINYLTITIPKPNIFVFISFYIIIIIFLYGKRIGILSWRRRRIIKKGVKVLNFLCIIYCIFWYIHTMYFEKYSIFFNVGQGNMALLHSNTTNIIVDIGSTRENNAGNIMLNFLKAKNIKHIDFIFITHAHSDHINGVATLIENNIDIERIGYLEPYEKTEEFNELTKIIKENKISRISLKENETVKIKDIEVDILSPIANNYINDSDMLNANSNVYLIDFNNKNYLFMGDATKNTEKYILNKYILFKYGEDERIKNINEKLKNISVYQVAHHGSKTSTDEKFISSISPCKAIISADEDVYGHPHEDVLELLKKYKFKIYITKKNGAIKL